MIQCTIVSLRNGGLDAPGCLFPSFQFGLVLFPDLKSVVIVMNILCTINEYKVESWKALAKQN